MFLTSFFKSKSSASETELPTPQTDTKSNPNMKDESSTSVNLPSWKDKSVWGFGKWTMDEERQSHELQLEIFGYILRYC